MLEFLELYFSSFNSPDLQNLNSKKMSVAKPDTQINHTFPFITVTSLFN